MWLVIVVVVAKVVGYSAGAIWCVTHGLRTHKGTISVSTHTL